MPGIKQTFALVIITLGGGCYDLRDCFGIIPADRIALFPCQKISLETAITTAEMINTKYFAITRLDDLAWELRNQGYKVFYLDIPDRGQISWKLME